jgi:hypothetical protein
MQNLKNSSAHDAAAVFAVVSCRFAQDDGSTMRPKKATSYAVNLSS